MKARALVRGAAVAAGALAAAYGGYVVWAWLGYGRASRGRGDEADALLDGVMPEYDVVERHAVLVDARAEGTLAAACAVRLEESRIVRAVFRGREILLGVKQGARDMSKGLVADMKEMGWGVVAEAPSRELVMGAVTQPWKADVVFRALAPERFREFRESGYVKIAWTLRAVEVGAERSILRTETRAVAFGVGARARFRIYWAFLSPGIILIRWVILGNLRKKVKGDG